MSGGGIGGRPARGRVRRITPNGKPSATILACTLDAPGGAGDAATVDGATKPAKPVDDSTGSGPELKRCSKLLHEKYFTIQSRFGGRGKSNGPGCRLQIAVPVFKADAFVGRERREGEEQQKPDQGPKS
jgi:hypothetical protein